MKKEKVPQKNLDVNIKNLNSMQKKFTVCPTLNIKYLDCNIYDSKKVV